MSVVNHGKTLKIVVTYFLHESDAVANDSLGVDVLVIWSNCVSDEIISGTRGKVGIVIVGTERKYYSCSTN